MKKFLSVILALGMLVSSLAVFAEDVPPMIGTVEPVLTYIGISGEITANNEFLNIVDGENEYDLIITEETLIYDKAGEKLTQDALVKDAKISAFIPANAPAELVLPPRYTPAVILVQTEKFGLVTVSTFNKEDTGLLLNSTNTLAFNIDENTNIVDKNGKAFTGDLDGRDLIVFYTMSTKSIPAQTTPDKVIVLDEKTEEKTFDPDMLYQTVVVNGKEIKIGANDAQVTGMVPVRAVAEAMGYTVEWDQNLQAVAIGTMQMGVNFRLGENAYKKAKMTAFVLSKAPVKIAIDDPRYGVTFVPVDFFTEVMEATAWSEGDVLYIRAETPDFDIEA